MAEVGLQEIETYVDHHQNTSVPYIATRSIMDLCLGAGQSPGVRVLKRSWKQESIDMEGILEAALVAEAEKGWRERVVEET